MKSLATVFFYVMVICAYSNGSRHLVLDSIKNDFPDKAAGPSANKLFLKENAISEILVNRKDIIGAAQPQPQPVSLPFGLKPTLKNFHQTQFFFKNLVYKHFNDELDYPVTNKKNQFQKTYDLPVIKNVKYIPLTLFGGIDSGICSNGQFFSNYIKLTKYRIKLPDINNYHCYYWCDQRHFYDKDYARRIKVDCKFSLPEGFYGYFILYDPKTMFAKVITIQLDTDQDDICLYRFFYIDKNYRIIIYENGAPGEAGGIPTSPYRTTLVSILKNGEINIKKY
jgi:hypothetical protein